MVTKRICRLDSDFERSIVFQRKIEVWVTGELDNTGLIQGYTTESVKIDGNYYLRSNCDFVMI